MHSATPAEHDEDRNEDGGEARHAAQKAAQDVAWLADFFTRYRHPLLLTGAGLSTASGIPDYRDAAGVRRGKAPMEGNAFRNDPALQKRYWARSMLGWPAMAAVQPNPGHVAIAALQAAGRVAALITQNVDGLHDLAGSSGTIELHGNIHRVVCLACGALSPRATIQSLLERDNPALIGAGATILPDGDALFEPDMLARFDVPCCLQCGGTLQPDVVFFGDGVPRARGEAAGRALAQADAVVVIGSSLMVFSGYRFCRTAAAEGKPVIAINRGVTRADALLGFKSEVAAEALLPLLARRLGAAREGPSTGLPSPALRRSR